MGDLFISGSGFSVWLSDPSLSTSSASDIGVILLIPIRASAGTMGPMARSAVGATCRAGGDTSTVIRGADCVGDRAGAGLAGGEKVGTG